MHVERAGIGQQRLGHVEHLFQLGLDRRAFFLGVALGLVLGEQSFAVGVAPVPHRDDVEGGEIRQQGDDVGIEEAP
ncbi:hypothetical protein D3C72_2492590 [compost metagenome]